MSDKIDFVHTEHAPQAVGPYSQATLCQGMLYVSGQIGLMPSAGKMIGDDIAEQAKQVMKNLSAVLRAAGSSKKMIVKANIFLVDMNDFPLINEIYADWLEEHRPARATVAVAALPLGAKIEIDVIAAVQ